MTGFKSSHAPQLVDYVKLRRGLGLRFDVQAAILRQFDRFLVTHAHEGAITQDLALQFASANPDVSRAEQARRYQVVRHFNEYLATFSLGVPRLDPHALRAPVRPATGALMSSVRSISLAKLLDSFFRERLAAQRRASPATIVAYRDSIRLLVLFAAKRSRRAPSRLRIEDLDRDVVLAFLDHLESDRGNTVRTRNARLGAIRSLFRHLACMDPTAMGTVERVLSIPTKRGPRGALDYLTVHELDMLLGSIDDSRPRGRRDYALLLFLARTGARVSEAPRASMQSTCAWFPRARCSCAGRGQRNGCSRSAVTMPKC